MVEKREWTSAIAALQSLVGEIGVKAPQLMRREHALVHEGPRGERREVALLDLVLRPLAEDEAHPLEPRGHRRVPFGRRGPVTGGGHEDLLYARRDLAGRAPRLGEVDGHRSPPEDVQALFCSKSGEAALGSLGLGGVSGEEGQPGAVLPGSRKRDPFGRSEVCEEAVRHLDEDPGAVAGLGVGAESPSVGQVLRGR